MFTGMKSLVNTQQIPRERTYTQPLFEFIVPCVHSLPQSLSGQFTCHGVLGA